MANTRNWGLNVSNYTHQAAPTPFVETAGICFTSFLRISSCFAGNEIRRHGVADKSPALCTGHFASINKQILAAGH